MPKGPASTRPKESRPLTELENENEKFRKMIGYGGGTVYNIAWLLQHATDRGITFNEALEEAIGEYRCRLEKNSDASLKTLQSSKS